MPGVEAPVMNGSKPVEKEDLIVDLESKGDDEKATTQSTKDRPNRILRYAEV